MTGPRIDVASLDDPLARLQARRRGSLPGVVAESTASGDPLERLKARKAAMSAAASGQPQPGVGASLLSGAAQGSTFGFADEVLGGIGALNSLLPKAAGGEGAPLSDFVKNYQRDRDKVRSFDAAAAQAHGLAHVAGNIAGGVLPIIATGGAAAPEGSLTSQLLTAAKQGAAYGGLQGAGSSASLRSTPKDVIAGGALGFATAPLMTLAGKGAAGAIRGLRGGDPDAAAQALIRQRIANSGTTPQDILDAVVNNTATSGEKPEMLGDYASEVAKLTKNVTKRPGAGRALVQNALETRNAGAAERVAGDLGAASGIGPRLPNAEELIRNRTANAAVDFPEAYHAGVVIDDPAIQELLQRPSFARAYRMAQTMAADEGRALPVRREVVQRLNPDFAAFLESVPEEARASVQERAVTANPSLLRTEVIEHPVPDVQTVAYVDRALRRLIDNGYEGGSPVVDPGHAHALQTAFGDFRTRLAALSPEYAHAIENFAQGSRSVDAAALGRRLSDAVQPTSTRATDMALGEGDPAALALVTRGLPAVQQAVDRMTPFDAAVFRQEARNAAGNAINRIPATEAGSTTGALRQVFPNSTAGRQAQALMFDTPAAAETFQHALARERNMARVGGLMSGSDTIENAAENAAVQPKTLLSLLRRPTAAIGRGLDYLENRRANSLYDHLAPLVATQGPGPLEQLLRQLTAAPATNPVPGQVGSLLRNLLVQREASR